MIFMLASWALTIAFIVSYLRAHLRLVRVARATHELRGPLFAVGLGLHALGGEPARLAAIELELARAGRALDDLAAAPAGAKPRTARELVDVIALVESYAPAWRTLAAGYGAELRVEPPLIVATGEAVSPAAAATCAWSRRRARAAAARPPAAPSRATPSPAAPSQRHAAVAASPPAASPRHAAVAASPPAASPRHAAAGSPRAASPAAVVFADPLRIAQACANLVGNAAEHGGGVVRVRVRATGRRVLIEVADDGPGLPASVSVLTAAARARRGRRGHGLAIAAAIAEHHGGRLHAAPSDGGARLMLEMPAAHDPAAA
ncbi:ATP-binding protein [Solirubrobacter soli]|uniref:ATP-binding protein n=1 Tax=Solirubrobacter soli TaxID=363832 RepID=UPI00042380DD|nr:ATP-binding protein [Solirubrobacter soli]